jgi:glycosyltransferase involved in cell wall biosynthesis
MEQMRFLYCHQYFSTPDGAAGTRSYEMARRLVERGHEVLMVCGSAERGRTGLDGPFVRGRRRGTVDGIDVLEYDLGYANADGVAKRALAFLRFAARSIGVALTEPYDLVFATTTPLTAGIPGIFARWFRGKPFVFEVRDLWPELPRAMGAIKNPLVLWAMSALEWASYRSARGLIGLSPGIVQGIARLGVKPDRIVLIPNGCDFGIFDASAQPWRPEGIRASDLMAVFAGAHGIANGLDAVLDAAAELKRRGITDVRIVLIGEGKLKPRLQERAAAEGLDSVIFHPPVQKGRLAGLMAATDVGLQILDNVPAFYYGTSPNKFFDYISAGLPVLINYPGWLAELVLQGGCGFAVPPADASAFADALVRAAGSPDDLRAMGRQASALAHEQFDRRVLADQFVDWLERWASP